MHWRKPSWKNFLPINYSLPSFYSEDRGMAGGPKIFTLGVMVSALPFLYLGLKTVHVLVGLPMLSGTLTTPGAISTAMPSFSIWQTNCTSLARSRRGLCSTQASRGPASAVASWSYSKSHSMGRTSAGPLPTKTCTRSLLLWVAGITWLVKRVETSQLLRWKYGK